MGQIFIGLADNGMPPVRLISEHYRDSDEDGFFAIEFGWSRLSDNAVILQSGPFVPYNLTAFTGTRIKIGVFSSSQVDKGYVNTSVFDQKLLLVPAFTSVSSSMISDWAKGDDEGTRKKIVEKLTDTKFFKAVKEDVDAHPVARLGGLRSNSMALIGAVEIYMDPR